MKNELDSKIVITGGLGFIGSHVNKYLKNRGYKNITIIDINGTAEYDGENRVTADFGNIDVVESVIEGADCVFHFAAMVGVDNCRLRPYEVRKINNIDTKKFIDLCIRKGVKRFLFSSSSEIYGNSIDIPYREDGIPEPFSDYAKCKLEIEKYLKDVQTKSDMIVGIVRLFNIYGIGQRDDFVIPIFVKRALKNLPMTILGNGHQTRCFTYVEDAIIGIFKVFRYSGSPFEIFNIGNSTENSINQLAQLVLEIIPKSSSKIVYFPHGVNVRNSDLEIIRRVPNIEKAQDLLDFRATISLKQGIINIVKSLTYK